MKNITVAVPDDVYQRARVAAAEQDSSVSALVTEFLRGLVDREGEFARLEAQQRAVQAQITDLRARDRLSRDQVHERALR